MTRDTWPCKEGTFLLSQNWKTKEALKRSTRRFSQVSPSIDRGQLHVGWATPAQCMAWRVVNGAIRPHHCHLRSATKYRGRKWDCFPWLPLVWKLFTRVGRWGVWNGFVLCQMPDNGKFHLGHSLVSWFSKVCKEENSQLFLILWFSVKSLQEGFSFLSY